LNWYQNLSAATGKTQDRKTKNQRVNDVGYTQPFGQMRRAMRDNRGDMILPVDQKEIW
jgi:hypothetical protein